MPLAGVPLLAQSLGSVHSGAGVGAAVGAGSGVGVAASGVLAGAGVGAAAGVAATGLSAGGVCLWAQPSRDEAMRALPSRNIRSDIRSSLGERVGSISHMVVSLYTRNTLRTEADAVPNSSATIGPSLGARSLSPGQVVACRSAVSKTDDVRARVKAFNAPAPTDPSAGGGASGGRTRGTICQQASVDAWAPRLQGSEYSGRATN
jgi:hypothetical protein